MIKLFNFPISQHSRRVVSLLEQAGIEYEPILIHLGEDAHLTPDFLRQNPNHQVPSMIDGDLVIHESNAILRYICRKHGLDSWYPTDPVLCAQVDQWLDWIQCRQSPAIVNIVFNQVFLGENGDKDAIARGHEQLSELNPILETALIGREYLVGQEPTIADLAMASNIFHLGFADAQPDTPNINRWFGNISKLEGYIRSLPPH